MNVDPISVLRAARERTHRILYDLRCRGNADLEAFAVLYEEISDSTKDPELASRCRALAAKARADKVNVFSV